MSDFGDSPASLPGRVVLDGWKEIAFHFGVTARTVQMWEAERGLPVHRKPGPKGRVFAYVDELQAWSVANTGASPAAESDDPTEASITLARNSETEDAKIGDSSGSAFPALPLPVAGDAPGEAARAVSWLVPFPLFSSAKGWHARTWLAISVAMLLAASGGAWAARQQSRRALVSVDASEWALHGLDDKGRILWSHRWEHPYFHVYAVMPDPLRPVVADLDGDGENEVYLWHECPRVDGHKAHNAILYSFDAAGQLRWKFEPDATLRTSYREFPPPYSGRTVRPVRYDGGQKLGILAVANHSMNYPSRVMLLSAEGTFLREYLHTGHLHLFLVEDFNQDGREEIYISGIANDYEAADLTVLDPDTMHGASAEPRRQLLGAKDGPVVARGTELRRVVLPRTYLGKTVDPYGIPGELRREGDSLILSGVEASIHLKSPPSTYFEFDRQLGLISTGVAESYVLSWEMLRKQGKLDRTFRQSDLDVLKEVRDVTGGRASGL